MRCWVWLALLLGLSLAWAQAPTGPVVSPRGVINAFTQQPAPSQVAQGGIVHINGLNLGPPEGAKAPGTPLPTQLGDPPTEVLIDGRLAPLFSASPERIVAQVPWETEPGLAAVVVRRGGVESRPARIQVVALGPAVRTAEDKGYGEVAGRLTGQTLAIPATGLGPTQPRVGSGEAGPEDPPARPRATVEAFVGGLPARSVAVLSRERVGEFDLRVEVPPGAQPGDVVTLTAGTPATGIRVANRATFQKLSNAEIQSLPIPEGAPEFHSLVTSDLRGNFLIASDARDENGCYPSYLFDVAAKKVAKIDTCLTTAARNAASPVIAATDGPALAALVGPPQGDAQTGISSKVQIFNPLKDPMVVELEAPAAEVRSAAGGDFEAVLAGTPPRRVTIDSQTGEVRAAGAAQPAAAAASGAPLFKVDLGEGLTYVLATVQVAQGLFAVLVADDAEQPKRAKVAVLNNKGEVQGARDFPAGWVPLVAPRPAAAAAGQVAQAAALLRRVSVSLDPEKGVFYILSRAVDNSQHALLAFSGQDSPPKLIGFPEKWFVAACSPAIPLHNLELSRKLAYLGSSVAETAIKDPCPGVGFVLLDLDAQSTTAVALPGQGQFDADPAASGEVNDYVYGSNTDPERRNTADTLFVLDGVTLSAFRMDLPAGITTFLGLTPAPAMNALIAPTMNRAVGDAGFVFFDLDSAEARVLPVPEGFVVVNLVGVYSTTRKLVARGTKAGQSGFQYLIYDLVSGDLLMPPNPEGVAFLGGVPARVQPGTAPGQPQAPSILQRANPKANTVTAFGYNAGGKQVAVVVLRVP